MLLQRQFADDPRAAFTVDPKTELADPSQVQQSNCYLKFRCLGAGHLMPSSYAVGRSQSHAYRATSAAAWSIACLSSSRDIAGIDRRRANRECRAASIRNRGSGRAASAAKAFCNRTWTSTRDALSRAMGLKTSSNSSPSFTEFIRTFGYRTASRPVGSLQIVSSRTLLPMTSIAVPGSLTAGDSARCAISASTDIPNRGS